MPRTPESRLAERHVPWFVSYEIAELRRRRLGGVSVSGVLSAAYRLPDEASRAQDEEDIEARLDAVVQAQACARRAAFPRG